MNKNYLLMGILICAIAMTVLVSQSSSGRSPEVYTATGPQGATRKIDDERREGRDRVNASKGSRREIGSAAAKHIQAERISNDQSSRTARILFSDFNSGRIRTSTPVGIEGPDGFRAVDVDSTGLAIDDGIEYALTATTKGSHLSRETVAAQAGESVNIIVYRESNLEIRLTDVYGDMVTEATVAFKSNGPNAKLSSTVTALSDPGSPGVYLLSAPETSGALTVIADGYSVYRENLGGAWPEEGVSIVLTKCEIESRRFAFRFQDSSKAVIGLRLALENGYKIGETDLSGTIEVPGHALEGDRPLAFDHDLVPSGLIRLPANASDRMDILYLPKVWPVEFASDQKLSSVSIDFENGFSSGGVLLQNFSLVQGEGSSSILMTHLPTGSVEFTCRSDDRGIRVVRRDILEGLNIIEIDSESNADDSVANITLSNENIPKAANVLVSLNEGGSFTEKFERRELRIPLGRNFSSLTISAPGYIPQRFRLKSNVDERHSPVALVAELMPAAIVDVSVANDGSPISQPLELRFRSRSARVIRGEDDMTSSVNPDWTSYETPTPSCIIVGGQGATVKLKAGRYDVDVYPHKAWRTDVQQNPMYRHRSFGHFVAEGRDNSWNINAPEPRQVRVELARELAQVRTWQLSCGTRSAQRAYGMAWQGWIPNDVVEIDVDLGELGRSIVDVSDKSNDTFVVKAPSYSTSSIELSEAFNEAAASQHLTLNVTVYQSNQNASSGGREVFSTSINPNADGKFILRYPGYVGARARVSLLGRDGEEISVAPRMFELKKTVILLLD